MFLLDTNICIYIIKKKPAEVLTVLKKKSKNTIYISSITVAELEYGIAKSSHPERNRIALIEFLSLFSILDFSIADAMEFGAIRADLERRGTVIGSMDMLLAAQAKANTLVLVTNNTREFDRVTGLKRENWVTAE